jgi:hypothetical protein
VTPTVEDHPEIEDAQPEDSNDSETPKAKVSSTTPCVCGHPRKDHHTTPESHDSDHAFYCILPHCAVFAYRDGVSAPCDCVHFRVNETDAPKFTKPRVGPYDLCGNPACCHFKISHCTKAKPGKVNRLKPGELAYRIMTAPGMSYGCRHFDPANPSCQCDSTGCSATPDGQNFCECLAFQNPWSVRKTRGASGKTRNRKSLDASPAVAATDSTPESVLAGEPVKPRRSRKKKSAFVTGMTELFPPVSVNP